MSVLLGFPGACVLAAMNWHRMGRTRKGLIHIAAAILGTGALFLVPDTAVLGLGLVIGVGIGYYLSFVQKIDRKAFEASGHVIAARNGFAGAVIGLVATLVIGVSVGGLESLRDGLGMPAPGVVAFGTGEGADVCHVAGQKTIFSPSDPIYLAAAMRQTVEPGAQIVEEVETTRAAAGSFAVPVKPPYDCLGSSSSIGPLAPGVYIIEYRDESLAGAPILASGTFTVSP